MANEVTYEQNCNTPACKGDCTTEINMPCDVCTLVHGDSSVKRCFYCPECKAYICCKKCRYDYVSRAKALLIRAGKNLKRSLSRKTKNAEERQVNEDAISPTPTTSDDNEMK